MPEPTQITNWWPIVLSSAGIAAVVSLAGNLVVWWLTARGHKLRKYEEELVGRRVEACQDLLRRVYALSNHLSPVAMGTSKLAKPSPSNALERMTFGQEDRSDIEKTFEMRVDILNFIEAHMLVLGKEICVTAVYFESGFDELAFKIGIDNQAYIYDFYSLCNWVWKFEDGIKSAIRRALRKASFEMPSSMDIQAARGRGHDDMRTLNDAVKTEPENYGIDARNKRLKKHGAKVPIRQA